MAGSDDMEIDPAIAEAMGFAGFGSSRKRKFDPNDGFVDPNIFTSHTQDKEMRPDNINPGDNALENSAEPQGTIKKPLNQSIESKPQEPDGTGFEVDGNPSLEALANGVRNRNGDMVYFSPSFIEDDPWRDLRSQ